MRTINDGEIGLTFLHSGYYAGYLFLEISYDCYHNDRRQLLLASLNYLVIREDSTIKECFDHRLYMMDKLEKICNMIGVDTKSGDYETIVDEANAVLSEIIFVSPECSDELNSKIDILLKYKDEENKKYALGLERLYANNKTSEAINMLITL